MGFCAERKVTISFLTEFGRFLARVSGSVSGNVLLRREQYRRADDYDFSALVARACITGKVANCRTVLQRSLRDHKEKLADYQAVKNGVDRMSATLRRLREPLDLDEVRGVEGDAAHVYFSVFNQLIIRNKKDFCFKQRNRRPPLDRMNCLLSFLYTLIMHDVRSALESVGLDPAVGYLHRDRPGRFGLALDIMEEFRPIADRLAISMVNLNQVKAGGFTVSENGAVRMDDKTRKTLLTAYQKRKQDILSHPFLEEKMPIGLFPQIQALLFARFLRGDLDGYPPVIWK